MTTTEAELLDALKNFTEGRDISYTQALVVAREAVRKAEASSAPRRQITSRAALRVDDLTQPGRSY
ncbi:hypothetical protein [Xanthobacter versatilis]|uniref:hypothetical protein n=1 Tax=Xanthobacter autotrophicus (strain ATCC BAA-1158 / Py2) TaxID=78245 RepID=UPI00372903C5